MCDVPLYLGAVDVGAVMRCRPAVSKKLLIGWEEVPG
jgi:hypothetical protein